MTHDKPDHDRLLLLLKNNPGRYYLTYQISEILGIMDNTVHRALDTIENKMGIPIDHKRDDKTRVMGYAWLAPVAPGKRWDAWRQEETACACVVDEKRCGSNYAVQVGGKWVCNVCGCDRLLHEAIANEG